MRTAKVISGVVVIVFSLGVLTSCAAPATEPERVPQSQGTGEATKQSTSTPTAAAIDITAGAPSAGTNEALAWEALMGPDGEYAAAASYQAVLNAHGSVEPYASIYQAELRHVDSLIRQLERSGIIVPENPYSGKITAPEDLTTAAQAWAEGEILNIEMYDKLIVQSTDATLTRVLNNLREASLNSHLPLFEKAALNGGTLTPEQMKL
jgi:hypothetical protein